MIKKITSISSLTKSENIDKIFTLTGWVKTIRKSKNFSFIVLNDGSTQDNFQIIADVTLSNFNTLGSVLTGSSLKITGVLQGSPGKEQNFELKAHEIEILGLTDRSYPLQKKGSSLEFLREKAHFRARTSLISAIFKVRHEISLSVHHFFSNRGFYYVHTPILTTHDSEGAGEMFRASTLNLRKDLPRDFNGNVDFTRDYFQKETYLCVTGQLELEALALGMGKVYSFGPIFRSENSNTSRHLAEFWMIEAEMAFYDLEDLIETSIDLIKFLVSDCLKKRRSELKVIDDYNKNEHIGVLENLIKKDFQKITYTEAVEILNHSDREFEFSLENGEGLQSEHERYLTEDYFKGPLVVTDYPKNCKAFYMKLNDDNKTVRGMDILLPGIGEIIGGSQREENLEKLNDRIEDLKIDFQFLEWYRELRRQGTAVHSGFGLGLERILMYITGMENIRDTIPFPRTPKNCNF